MRKRKLNKAIKKSITHSFGRFISIMLLMALGSFALVGLAVTGPDMRQTGINYFTELNTSDLTILSDYGIDESEQEYIEKASGIKEVEYIYLKDVTIKDSNDSFRVFSKPKSISLYELTEGKFPEEDNEIAISDKYKGKYNIGDTINFNEKINEDENPTLKVHEFKIVGFINSGEILSSLNLGQTTVGTGELNGYAIVNETVFDSSVYMMAKLTFTDTENLDPYSDEYNDKIQIHKEELSKLLTEQQEIRLANIKSEYQTEIDDGQKELDDAKAELEDARTKLKDAKSDLDDAKVEIANNENKLIDAQNQINEATTQISDSEIYLNQKQSEYDSGVVTLATKQAEYNSGMTEFSQKEAEYNVAVSELDKKKLELETAKAQIEEAQKEIDTNSGILENSKKQYEDGISNLNKAITELTSNLSNPDFTSNLTDEEKLVLEQTLESYTKQLSEITIEYNLFIDSTYNTGLLQISNAQNELDLKKQELKAGKILISESEKELEMASKQLETARQELASAKNQLDSASNELNSAKTQLDNGRSQLANGKAELENAKSEYASGIKKLNDAKKEVAEKEIEYNDKLAEFNSEEPDALKEIEENENKLNDAREKLEKLELPTYSVDNRRELPGGEGYSIYETVSEIVDSLAKVFPVFLYFVAALVTLTTMTRFVGEERINNGTLKSLGYSDRDVIKKFAIYGFTAGMIGTILGIILGHTLIPMIVYKAYSGGFTIPKIELHFYLEFTILAIVLSLISSVVPAVIVTKKELQDTTASLLQPKSPKAGSKIFLEKIKPIWSRMKFTQKVTARNIFRYKQRMFMTIFGVAGAASILFAGFSVQSSISGINERQFKEIIKYNAIVALNDDLSSDEENELQDLLNAEEIKSYASIYYEEISKQAGKNNDNQEIKLIVPEDTDKFNDYISLLNRKTNENIELSNDGVIISERLSTLLNVNVGDIFTYIDSKDKEREVKVTGICEMYAGHFVFMNVEEYKNVYNDEFETNAKLLLLNDTSLENTQIQSAKFMELSAVKGVVQNTTLYNQIDTIVQSLNKIMLVLIIVASMLAIVILYNLTNINVAERIRELCTIKVLGFHDNETTMYIYRETIILSIFGIIVGWLIGILLHKYILNVVPPDSVMFNPTIWIGAYIIPFIVITFVTFILKYYVNNKLKNVDMLEALKSVD